MTEALRAAQYPATVPVSRARSHSAQARATRAKAKAQAKAARPPRQRPLAEGSAALAHAEPAPDEARSPRERHLELVGQRARARRARQHRARMLLGLAAAGTVVVAFALVYLHVLAAQRQFTLDDLNTQVSRQEATYQRLQLQVAELNAPARIVSIAENKLGMVQPSSVTYLSPSASASSAATTVPPTTAPAGDADWPQIKALIAGTP